MSEDEKYGFLNDEAAEAEVQETAPETVIPETVAETPPATPAAVVPTTTEPEATHVPLAALRAEREKRQRAEQEIARLSQQQAPQPEVPAFYEAPEQHIQAVLSQAEQRAQARLFASFEEDAREAFADYDEVLAELAEAANENPALRHQVFSSANPAKAAYKLGKQLRALKSAPDPAALRVQIEAEVRAQIAKEAQDAAAARAAQVAAIPPDLSATRSARDANAVAVGEDSLDSILATRRKR